jgi:flagellar basal body rod protein FlgC
MAELSGTDLLGFMLTNTASMRVEQYRREAVKFRAMAEAETDYTLHSQLVELARGYDQLAENSRV